MTGRKSELLVDRVGFADEIPKSTCCNASVRGNFGPARQSDALSKLH